MSPAATIGILSGWLVLGGVLTWLLRSMAIRRRVAARLDSRDDAAEPLRREDRRSVLGWWLFRAGFRSPRAPAGFLTAVMVSVAVGAGFVLLMYQTGAVDLFVTLLSALPGGVGEVFLPLAWSSAWMGGILLGTIPALVVRSARRNRVTAIEQDLPITLDLLATLAEAGLGFDSGLDRILESQSANRPLAEDLRLFQLDVLAGRTRVEALRGLMKRVDVPWFSIFVSAVIHAEQVGSSLAQTLRTQADDLRIRRRERALAFAMAIPVKLVFPLIVCFLPGIMTASLGPVVYQIVQVLDQFLKGSLGR